MWFAKIYLTSPRELTCFQCTKAYWWQCADTWIKAPADDLVSSCQIYTGLFISPSGISELDCATTKTDTAERSISIGTESLQVFFLY